jgi:hypothetical protein
MSAFGWRIASGVQIQDFEQVVVFHPNAPNSSLEPEAASVQLKRPPVLRSLAGAVVVLFVRLASRIFFHIFFCSANGLVDDSSGLLFFEHLLRDLLFIFPLQSNFFSSCSAFLKSALSKFYFCPDGHSTILSLPFLARA